jgi:hypothetical protein
MVTWRKSWDSGADMLMLKDRDGLDIVLIDRQLVGLIELGVLL